MLSGSFKSRINYQDVVDAVDCSVWFGVFQSALVSLSGEKCPQGM